jgi:hypothetical protein
MVGLACAPIQPLPLQSIAKIMNENYVNIKVDREERPDVDKVYVSVPGRLAGHAQPACCTPLRLCEGSVAMPLVPQIN